jgi:hypothetical protein
MYSKNQLMASVLVATIVTVSSPDTKRHAVMASERPLMRYPPNSRARPPPGFLITANKTRRSNTAVR